MREAGRVRASDRSAAGWTGSCIGMCADVEPACVANVEPHPHCAAFGWTDSGNGMCADVEPA